MITTPITSYWGFLRKRLKLKTPKDLRKKIQIAPKTLSIEKQDSKYVISADITIYVAGEVIETLASVTVTGLDLHASVLVPTIPPAKIHPNDYLLSYLVASGYVRNGMTFTTFRNLLR